MPPQHGNMKQVTYWRPPIGLHL